MNSVQTQQGYSAKSIVMILVDSVLNYLRWTQFIQLLAAFGIAVLVVVLITVSSFQEQTTNVINTVLNWIVQLPGVTDYLKKNVTEDNINRLSDVDMKSYLITAWAALSLVGLLLENIWYSAMQHERQPWSLRRKIHLVMLGCFLLLGATLADFFMHREMFKGGTGGWIVSFVGLAFILFIVCLWNLMVIYVFDLTRARLAEYVSQE